MKRFALFVSCFVFCGYVYSYCGDLPVITTKNSEGKEIGIVISGSMIARTASWNPIESSPPLTINNASTKLLNWLKRKHPNYDDIKINRIALNSYECTRFSGKWYYFFEFSFLEKGNELFGIANWAAILMDGTIIDVTLINEAK